MEQHTTPYVYGDERPDGGLARGTGSEDERVIVDGAVTTFRSYRRDR